MAKARGFLIHREPPGGNGLVIAIVLKRTFTFVTTHVLRSYILSKGLTYREPHGRPLKVGVV
jgi:hypothetical protein